MMTLYKSPFHVLEYINDMTKKQKQNTRISYSFCLKEQTTAPKQSLEYLEM